MKKITLRQPEAALVALGTSELHDWGTPPKVGDIVQIHASTWKDDWKDDFEPFVTQLNEYNLRRLTVAQCNTKVGAIEILSVEILEKSSKGTYWQADHKRV